MLFDLQSPGRRRIIKVVYALLAGLLAIGLVGFGIGSDATGGISDIFSGGGSADTGFEDQIEDAETKAEETPKDQAAQLALVTLYLQDGNAKIEQDAQTGQPIVTADAEESFTKAADAFAAYLALKPQKPDTGAALQMASTYFLLAQSSTSLADAVGQVENAADAQRVAADADPSAGNLKNLAYYLFLAGQFDQAEQAVQDTIAASPPGQQKALTKQFEQLQKQGETIQKELKKQQKQGAATEGENPLGGAGGALGGGTGALGGP